MPPLRATRDSILLRWKNERPLTTENIRFAKDLRLAGLIRFRLLVETLRLNSTRWLISSLGKTASFPNGFEKVSPHKRSDYRLSTSCGTNFFFFRSVYPLACRVFGLDLQVYQSCASWLHYRKWGKVMDCSPATAYVSQWYIGWYYTIFDSISIFPSSSSKEAFKLEVDLRMVCQYRESSDSIIWSTSNFSEAGPLSTLGPVALECS